MNFYLGEHVMEEVIERIQDEIFLIFMILFMISVFSYIITEKLSFISMFLCLTVSLLAINKETHLIYAFLFFILGIISLITMLDIDMWMEMNMRNMNPVQRIIRVVFAILLLVPLLQIISSYSFINNFKLNFRSISFCFASLILIYLVITIVPRYILVFISRLKSKKKITSFVVLKAIRYKLIYGMIQSKLYVKDGIREYNFEVSNRAYKMLRKKSYVNIEIVEGNFGTYYVKNNFLGKERLRTLKEDLPRFFAAFAIIATSTIIFMLFWHIIHNYAWAG